MGMTTRAIWHCWDIAILALKHSPPSAPVPDWDTASFATPATTGSPIIGSSWYGPAEWATHHPDTRR